MSRIPFSRVILAASAALALAVPASAQQGKGSVHGTITGPTGPVMGARVSIERPPRVAIVDERGEYTLRGVPAGGYEIVVTALGYKPARQAVNVIANQEMPLDFTLEQGSLMLSSVVTTATRMPTLASQVATTVNVLTPQEIETSPARESQDLLREIPGVELPRTSSLVGGTAQIVSMRGVDEGRTAVTFDGFPINDAWGEWIDWGRVPKGMLDRVEVVEGGTSSLYGNGAMGGVISFFSRPLAPGEANMLVEGGSRDMRHGYVSGGLPVYGAVTAMVSGDYQEGGGYTMIDPTKRGTIDMPSSIIQRNAYARLNYAPSATFNAFVGGHMFGDNRNLGTPLGYQTRDQGDVNGGLDFGTYGGGLLSVRAWDGKQQEHQRATAIRAGGRIAEDSSVVASIPSHDWGASAMWTRSSWMHLESFSLGGDYRHMQGNYDEVDFSTACPGVNCGTVTRRVLSGGDQALSGVFAQAIASPLTPLRLEMSARVDQWNNNDGHSIDAAAGEQTYADRSMTAFSPRLGARYQLLSSLSFHSAVYKAFRAPNLAELYRKQISATSITIPNPDLSPETALGREIGLDWQPTQWVQMKGTYYVADYRDFNVPTTIPNASNPQCGAIATCRQRLNVSSSRSQGAEGYVAVRPLNQLLVSASVNYDDDRQQSGIPAGQPKPHINRVPSPKQTIRATYDSRWFGDWTAIWRHEGTTTTLQGFALDPYTVADATWQRELLPGFTSVVSLENITNAQYEVSTTAAANGIASFGLPRTLRVGVRVERW
ncbi:MAG TPA: TonB-dependent receptor [Gemmatimonadaceae bacterium]|nr:TonB-dependent receptor [Gemmatimonadaceae bacterium]